MRLSFNSPTISVAGVREFWRFVQVQQTVGAAAQSLIEDPPMQAAASFNLATIKEEIEAMMRSHEGQKTNREAGAPETGP